jgi:hypothetical protein
MVGKRQPDELVARASRHLAKTRAALTNAEQEFKRTIAEAVTAGRITDAEAKVILRTVGRS